jgi:hypothetical protein
MSTEDEDFADRLIAAYRAAEPTKPASDVARGERKDPVVDDDVDQRFADRLLKSSNRKWRERDDRRVTNDRREAQDRWRRP